MRKKCAFCGQELQETELVRAFNDSPEYQHLVEKGLISDEEECPYCGYHNEDISEISSDLYYSVLR